MSGINEFRVVLETDPKIKKRDIEGIVREALTHLDPDIFYDVRFKGIELTNKPGKFIQYDPQEDDR